ncbi:MAG: nucleotidyltransferase domain-containing protein [candidate division KSB1 bacterium]|nr:nucleotidyltransferase domain-containing protein [candidate division KSB1 bacterium]
MNRQGIESRLKGYFTKRPEVLFAYLFGSQAKGRSHRFSDIDVAIFVDYNLCQPQNFGYEAYVIADLMQVLKTNDVDLVILNEASPLLSHQVIKYGRLVFSRDEARRIHFVVESFKKYGDTQKMRDIQWEYLRKRIRSGSFARS